LTVVVAVVCSVFASMTWPVAMLALAGLNVVASIVFWRARRFRICAWATSFFLLMTLSLTDWCSSSFKPVTYVAWMDLVLAGVFQAAALIVLLFSDPPIHPKACSSEDASKRTP